MKEILGCPHCHIAFGGVRNGQLLCPDCNGELIPLNIAKETWDTYSDDKKKSIKEDFFRKIDSNYLPFTQQLSFERLLIKLSKDINTIKNITVFFLVIWIISLFLSIAR